jgi:hypothetical protein
LNKWAENPSGKNFERVMSELVNGNSFLMLPSINDDEIKPGWIVVEGSKSLKLTCLYEVEGVKVIGGFTDNESVYRWSKASAPYTSMRSQDVFKLCEANDIYKIVINSDSPNIFLAQRHQKS